MKILYAFQATGNGHIARAIELAPHLNQYGNVDFFLSGSNASLRPDLNVKFRSKGLSLFYTSTGALDSFKILKQLNPIYLNKEIKNHQASFQSVNTPRPLKKSPFSEFVLKNYCSSPDNVGFHFKPYEDWIQPPVIKEALWHAKPHFGKHITVYLPHYSDSELKRYLYGIEGIKFEVFSKETKRINNDYNITWLPVSNEEFSQSMISSSGVICGAGFETPAEALFLGKPLIVIPIQGQYEQHCNAAALEEFNVTVLQRLDLNFSSILFKWLKSNHSIRPLIKFQRTETIVKSFINNVLSTHGMAMSNSI